MKKKILFATKNNGKFKEVSHIFGEEYFELLSLNDFNNVGEIIETGSTFEENAVLKSKYVFDKFHLPTIADDSGLVVSQLNGKPGVFSARYAGTNATDDMNNNKLLSKLFNLPKPHEAKFVCSAVFYDGNDFLKGFGEVTGHIIDEPRGINGFGYDPLFVPDGFSKTTAELDLEEKNKISHRAKAFKSLLKIIIARLT